MAAAVDINRDRKFYIDTDRKIRFKPWAELPTPTSLGEPVDASGWSLEFLMAPQAGAAPYFTPKTVGSGIAIVGAYNADPKLHAQYIEVTIERANTAGITDTEGVHQLRRTDPGASDVLADGKVRFLKPAHAIP